MKRVWFSFVASSIALGCATAGSTWISEPMNAKEDDEIPARSVGGPMTSTNAPEASQFRTRVIGGDDEEPEARDERIHGEELQGRVLGTFRNTYYDFPLESDFAGDAVALRNDRCEVVAQVPRGFHDTVCVQGSGILKSGRPISFQKRDCDCAEVCPKTGQKICFETLDRDRFPWGRGALGTPITPLLTVAVDDSLVPMGSAIYIPEFDGLPVDPSRNQKHDGCFIAQDRGLRVKGMHVDVFTGQSAITELWNHLVPSNRGVTVVLDSPRCSRARIDTSAILPERPSRSK